MAVEMEGGAKEGIEKGGGRGIRLGLEWRLGRKISEKDWSILMITFFTHILQEIEKAWKMVDAAHDKEQRARETIQSLKLEIANLSKLVEQGAGLTMGQDHRFVVHVYYFVYSAAQWEMLKSINEAK